MNKDGLMKFGIEIEIIVSPYRIKDLQETLNCYGNILEYNTEQEGYGYLFRDLSLDPTNLLDYGFEIKTKVLTLGRLDYVYELLKDLENIVTANDSCSIHVHVSRNGFSLVDHYNILYGFLKSGGYKKILTDGEYRFENFDYANLNDAKVRYLYPFNKILRDNKIKTIDSNYEAGKSSMYRVCHGYNTIEFRGLRHHFCDKVSTDNIYNMILKYLLLIGNTKINYELKKLLIVDDED